MHIHKRGDCMVIAHSANDQGLKHDLKDHLEAVSRIAQSFAITDLQKEILKDTSIFHLAAGHLKKFTS